MEQESDQKARCHYCTKDKRMMLHSQFAEHRKRNFPARQGQSVSSLPCECLETKSFSETQTGSKQVKDSSDDESSSDETLSSGELSSSESSSYEDSSMTSSSDDSDIESGDISTKPTTPNQLHGYLCYNEKAKFSNIGSCQYQGHFNRELNVGNIDGEQKIAPCDPLSSNIYRLNHYRIVVSPSINFTKSQPSSIQHGGKLFNFTGFSLFSHQQLENIPQFSFRRYRREYTADLVLEPSPQIFCTRDLDLISDYIMKDILELYDFDCGESRTTSCRSFHFLPRFEAFIPDTNTREILPSDVILRHLYDSFRLLFEAPVQDIGHCWRQLSKIHRDTIVVKPDKRPRGIRIDDIFEDRDYRKSHHSSSENHYPVIYHLGTYKMESQLLNSKSYGKVLRHIKMLTKKINTSPGDDKSQEKLRWYQNRLTRLRNKSERQVQVILSSKGFYKTGIGSDVCQHALLLPAICQHIFYHWSLGSLEAKLNYSFESKSLLEIALTHQSYETTYGTSPVHIQNSLTNCGIRQPFYANHGKSHIRTKRRGLMYLIKRMSELGSSGESFSNIKFNESLEFLGDAVLDLLTSTRLFYMLRDSNEGTLSIFRSALVQNSKLLKIGKELKLWKYILISNCSKIDEAVTGSVEALIGAVYLEGGLYVAEQFIARLFFTEKDLRDIWLQPLIHPLQEEHPDGDRFFIESSNVLKKLVKFENEIGLKFHSIRLLAKAFMHPAAGMTALTRGNNQRLEFLGDAILKFITSDYVYKHFPDHHEGHLTLLRNSMVTAKCQARVACDLGLEEYIDFGNSGRMPKNAREKLLADVFEAFIAAVYVDKNLMYCKKICDVCLFTRLKEVIIEQNWLDPKSQLQNCCLTLPPVKGMSRYPKYKTLQEIGNSDTKVFKVAVYFRKRRLGTGRGKSKRNAQMDAAQDALKSNYFEALRKQKNYVEKKFCQRRYGFKHSGPKSKNE